MKNIIYVILLISMAASVNLMGQSKGKKAAKSTGKVKVTGVYSDVTLDYGSGDITGFGTLEIKKTGKKFVGDFSQSQGTEGRNFPKVRVKDLKISEKDGKISFKVKWCLEDDTVKTKIITINGKISKKGAELKIPPLWENAEDLEIFFERRK